MSSLSNRLFAFFSESDFHFISMIHDVVLMLEFGHFSLNSALIPTLSEWWWHDLEIDIIVHEHGNERQIHEKTHFIIWLTKRKLCRTITKLCKMSWKSKIIKKRKKFYLARKFIPNQWPSFFRIKHFQKLKGRSRPV